MQTWRREVYLLVLLLVASAHALRPRSTPDEPARWRKSGTNNILSDQLEQVSVSVKLKDHGTQRKSSSNSPLSKAVYTVSEQWRETRGSSKDLCGLSGEKVLSTNPQMFEEKAESLQAAWVGRDEILIVASDEKASSGTTVWLGKPKGSHGVFMFEAMPKAIGEAVSPSSLKISSVDGNYAFVTSFSGYHMYVSMTAGQAWTKYATPTSKFNPSDSVLLSKSSPTTLAIHTSVGELFVSERYGQSWSLVSKNVETAKFAFGPTQPHKEFLYFSVMGSKAKQNHLYRLDVPAQSKKELDAKAYRFVIDGNFLYVSRQNFTGSDKVDQKSRRLYVSSNFDSDEVTFAEVQLPSLKEEQLYILMATHESGAFIHVAHDPDSPTGNLFMSDSKGSRFSLSLSNHMYHSIKFGFMSFTVDDFYEVESSRGVYITSTVEDAGHISVITFNNGGSWQRLSPPANSHCDPPSCSLHIHFKLSHLLGGSSGSSEIAHPLSTKTAMGIIIAHGSLGAVRENSDTKLYISNNGGHTWMDPGFPNGSYVYGISDYGNIIAVAPTSNVVEFIWFSHDRGNCFKKELLDSTDVFHLSRGLLMDPSASSLYAFVLGVEGEKAEDPWKMVTINFGSLLSSKCNKEDYVNVTEHVMEGTCLMGYKSIYNLTKNSSICFNEDSYQFNPIAVKTCLCGPTDFECDYGFMQNGSKCVREAGFKLSDVCLPDAVTYKESNSGFRLIPGDKCQQTDESLELLRQVEQPCTGHEHDSGYTRVKTEWKVFGAFLLVVAIIALALLMLYVFLKCRQKPDLKERVYYERVPLNEPKREEDESESDEDLISAA